jgi:hypothetical protein
VLRVASALLSVSKGWGSRGRFFLIKQPLRATSAFFRTAFTGELEGEAAPAAEVGGEPERRTGKAPRPDARAPC